MRYFLLFSLLLNISCNSPKKSEAPHQPLVSQQNNRNNAQAITANQEFFLVPRTHTAFLWPAEINWEVNGLYEPQMSEFEKLKNCARSVSHNSSLYDGTFPLILQLQKEKSKIENQIQTNCVNNCLHLKDDLQKIEAKLNQIVMDQSHYLEIIPQSLDEDPDHPVNNLVQFKNGTKAKFKIDEQNMIIEFKKFGPWELKYSNKNGGIQNIVYQPQESRLEFDLMERDQNDQLTGFRYHFKYAILGFYSMMRLNGDIQYINSKNQIERYGKSRIDLLPK